MPFNLSWNWREWSARNRADIDQFLVTYPKLMWLQKWLEGIFDNQETLQKQIDVIGNIEVIGENTASIDVTINDEPMTSTVTFDPISQTMTTTFAKPNITAEANLNLSKETEQINVVYPDLTFTYQAENAITVNSDGAFVPDLMPAITDLASKSSSAVVENQRNLQNSPFVEVSSFANVGNVFSSSKQFQSGYRAFFEKETGYYFNLKVSMVNMANFEPSLSVFDKEGNFICRVVLNALPGNIIGQINNYFIEYDRNNGVWYIEIGCSNETAMAFKLPKSQVDAAANLMTKTTSITEFVSIETFVNIIGSDNTQIPFGQNPDTFWYNQTIYALFDDPNQSGNFQLLTGTRQDFYNASALVPLVDTNNILLTSSFVQSASVDMYGTGVFVFNSMQGVGGTQTMILFNIANGQFSKLDSVAISPSSTGGNNTLFGYTNKHGSQMTMDNLASNNYLVFSQIMNMPKSLSWFSQQYVILTSTNVADSGGALGSNSVKPVVFAYGNGSANMYGAMINAFSSGMSVGHGNAGDNLLAGYSKRGEFSITTANNTLFLQGFSDSPDKQTNLRYFYDYTLLPTTADGLGWTAIKTNSKMSDGGIYTEHLTLRNVSTETTNAPFSSNYTVDFVRQNRISDGTFTSEVGRWTVFDGESIGNKFDFIDSEIAQLFSTDVGNHLEGGGVFSETNEALTLTLTRKDLNGTVLTSDVIDIDGSDIYSRINAVQNQLTNYIANNVAQFAFLTQLYNNLNGSGAYSGGEGTGSFNDNIAYGNMNLFGDTSFIRTNEIPQNENDIFGTSSSSTPTPS